MNKPIDKFSTNNSNQAKTRKTLIDCLPYITKMNTYQLKLISINEAGEFLTCATSKVTLDVINHIKDVFRARGFGCYALHNYIWIVPFIHESLHMPDFERAKSVLPDFKADLYRKLFSQEEKVIKVKKHKQPHKISKRVLGIVSVVATVLICALYQAIKTQ